MTYTTEVTGDSPVTARVIALDMARQTIMSLDASSLETTSTQRPESAPLGTLMTTGHGSNQLVWVPVGPLPADEEHPATDGGMLVLKGGTIIPDDTVPLPGPARSMGWDSVANLVFVAGPSQVWAIEPHGDNRSGYGVFDETPVDGTPGPMAFDISDTSQTDDHGTLVLATARGDAGALVSIDVSDNAYAWRLASALFGAALAGLVYLLDRHAVPPPPDRGPGRAVRRLRPDGLRHEPDRHERHLRRRLHHGRLRPLLADLRRAAGRAARGGCCPWSAS